MLAVTTLRGPDGQPFPALEPRPGGPDPHPRRPLVITSEGIATRGIAPFVREFDLAGRQIAELPVPDYFDPVGGTRGVRQNLGFEAAAVAPHGHALFVGAENALAQDGPAASTTTGSNARLLRYHLGKKQHGPDQEWVYPTEHGRRPVADRSP